MTQIRLGILHPGEMGISIAASAQNAQLTVLWVSAGRSKETIDRANQFKLIDAGDIANLCKKCEIIISVCPPEAADDVAKQVLEQNFTGLYVEANAISPQRSVNIGKSMTSAGVSYVDGGIIGPPAWKSGATCLYLSGERAEYVSRLFEKSPLSAQVLGEKAGDASALKMCYAAYTKALSHCCARYWLLLKNWGYVTT